MVAMFITAEHVSMSYGERRSQFKVEYHSALWCYIIIVYIHVRAGTYVLNLIVILGRGCDLV